MLGDEKPETERQRRMRREHLSNYANIIFVQGFDSASPPCLRMCVGAGEPVAPADAAQVCWAPLLVCAPATLIQFIHGARARRPSHFCVACGHANVQWKIPQHLTAQEDEHKEERGWRQPITSGHDTWLHKTLDAGRKPAPPAPLTDGAQAAEAASAAALP